jgi:lysozyme
LLTHAGETASTAAFEPVAPSGLGSVSPAKTQAGAEEMSTPSNIVQQLLRDEGTILHAYQDSEGYWTIGTGICIDKRVGCGITDAENLYLLNNRITLTTQAICAEWPWAAQLDPVRLAVMVNMAFEMGTEGLSEFHNFLAAMEAGDWPQAGAEMLDSLWAKEVPERAGRLAKQVVSGGWK